MTTVTVEQRNQVVVLTLSSPQSRNALSRQLLGDLREALGETSEQGVRAVVLAGAGQVFSAGADIGELTGTIEDLAADEAIAATVEAIRACPLPVVAAIEGACMGAAVDLALASDVRVVAEDAFFAVPAVALGILYSPEALERMAGRVPHQTLARLLLIGERITGEQAVVAGLASLAVPTGETLDSAIKLASRCAGNSPEAGAATKSILNSLSTGAFDPAEWQEPRRALLASDARAERIRSAKERMEKKS